MHTNFQFELSSFNDGTYDLSVVIDITQGGGVVLGMVGRL